MRSLQFLTQGGVVAEAVTVVALLAKGSAVVVRMGIATLGALGQSCEGILVYR